MMLRPYRIKSSGVMDGHVHRSVVPSSPSSDSEVPSLVGATSMEAEGEMSPRGRAGFPLRYTAKRLVRRRINTRVTQRSVQRLDRYD